MRAPNMSERTTEMAESTKIHRIARYANRISMSVSSDTVASSVGDEAHRHRRVADLHGGSVVQRGLLHLVPVDQHAVRGAQIDDADVRGGPFVGVDADLGVPPGDARV